MTLAELRKWCEILASERTKDPQMWQDCVQEGMIAAWVAQQTKPDAPDVYLRVAAKNGVNKLLRGRGYFGAEPHRGAKDAHTETVSYDGPDCVMNEPSYNDPESYESTVLAALGTLSEQDAQYVFMRFWLDLHVQEISARLGVPRGTLERRWVEKIRPVLREELETLWVS